MASDPTAVEGATFVFGAFTLDTRTQRLLREGTVVPLTTKAFCTLEVLLRAAGRTVTKEDLLKQVWPGTFVQEDTLAQNISTIRRALGETADSPRHVLTVPRDGYRFVAPVDIVYGEPAGESLATERPAASQVKPHRVRYRRWILQFSLGAASMAMLAALAFMGLREPASKRPPSVPIAFDVFAPDGARFSSSGGVLALSPDGRHLAFVAEGPDRQDQLWIRASGSRESTPLAGTQDASQPFWSADGRSIAFFSRGALRSIDISGDEVHTVSQLPSNAAALAGSWSSRDLILFSLQGKGLFQVRASGGEATHVQLPGMDECAACLWPFFLPDGGYFLFTVVTARSDRGIYIGSLDGAAPRRLLDVVSSTAYTTDGYLIYASAGALVARRFDALRGLSGDIVPVADRVWFNPFTARAVFSASNAGLLAYSEPVATHLRWISHTGDVISTGPEAVFHNFAVSRTGRVLASQLDPQLGTYDLWLHDPEWRTATRLTFDAASDLRPLWSDDGTGAVFARDLGPNGWQLYGVTVDRPPVERPLLPQPTPDILEPILWQDDVLYYASWRPGEGERIWKIRTGRDDRPTPVTVSDPSSVYLRGRISPDGRWLAYTVNVIDSRLPHSALFVRPWPVGPGRTQIAPEGSLPRWRPDGGELFFIAPNGRLMSAPVRDGVAIGPPVPICPTDALATSGLAGNAYDATADGQRFLVKVPAHRPSIVVMSGWSAK